ncbi:pirin family protein [Geodermatophilus sp. DSM 44513]|uniref:pirin family protein n=1 Tax=Geodermatophilus sp. DSM 44513 TaxID=1528104 RepID=UPI00126FA6BD|nr:pirin family protein [Geodermatophilus sp. DSM 44513]WNV77178.1 pirin family protein [Geodermatophilus sp. DSM 44513]
MTPTSDVLVEPDDGSAGPLLRIAEDRLAPGTGYGRHPHRAVDVVAVVLAGSLRHDWDAQPVLAAGDVAVLRAGAGLEHDEVAGDDGAHVLQTYLRSDRAAGPATHEVHRAVAGWVDLARADARLWTESVEDGTSATVPPGLLVLTGPGGARVRQQDGDEVHGPATAVVWQLDTTRPAWADDA